jgi:hypothetical protein
MACAYVVIGVLFLLLGVGALALALIGYLRGRTAANWPTAAGVVTGTRIEESASGRGGFVYKPVVLYRYEVSGVEYQGSRIRFQEERTVSSHSAAEKLLQSYAVSSPVRVRYNPRKPQESVLEPGSSVIWFLFGLVVAFLLIALGALGVSQGVVR